MASSWVFKYYVFPVCAIGNCSSSDKNQNIDCWFYVTGKVSIYGGCDNTVFQQFFLAFGIIMASLKPSKALYFTLIRSFLVSLLSHLNYLICNVGAFLVYILSQFFFGDSLSGSNDLVRFQSFDKKCKAVYACKILIYVFWTIFMFLSRWQWFNYCLWSNSVYQERAREVSFCLQFLPLLA